MVSDGSEDERIQTVHCRRELGVDIISGVDGACRMAYSRECPDSALHCPHHPVNNYPYQLPGSGIGIIIRSNHDIPLHEHRVQCDDFLMALLAGIQVYDSICHGLKDNSD